MGAGRQAAPPHPFQTALTPPGLETPVTDADAAETFYRNVIGWRMQDAGMPGMRYTIVSVITFQKRRPKRLRDSPHHWHLADNYFLRGSGTVHDSFTSC